MGRSSCDNSDSMSTSLSLATLSGCERCISSALNKVSILPSDPEACNLGESPAVVADETRDVDGEENRDSLEFAFEVVLDFG